MQQALGGNSVNSKAHTTGPIEFLLRVEKTKITYDYTSRFAAHGSGDLKAAYLEISFSTESIGTQYWSNGFAKNDFVASHARCLHVAQLGNALDMAVAEQTENETQTKIAL